MKEIAHEYPDVSRSVAVRLFERLKAGVEEGLEREPVATAVALGLVGGAITSSFGGFVLGVVSAIILRRT